MPHDKTPKAPAKGKVNPPKPGPQPGGDLREGKVKGIKRSLLERLRTAIVQSESKLAPFRNNAREMVKELAGFNYSEHATAEPRPVNLIDLMATTYAAHVVPHDEIRALVTTRHLDLKGVAADLALAIDHQAKQMGLADAMRGAFADALVSALGIVKMGLGASEEIDIDGALHDPGQVFADNVALEDYFFDVEAKRWDLVTFEGDRYTMPLELLKESGRFDSRVVNQLTPDDQSERPGGPERHDGESMRRISRGRADQEASLYDDVELMDVWLPFEGVVVTLAARQDVDPLAIVPWEGPEHGPYHKLRLKEVPGQLMPVAPLSHVLDLQGLVNSIWRKVQRQAQNTKENYLYRGEAEEDMERIRGSQDGEAVRKDSAMPIETIRTRGPDQQLVGLAGVVRDLFSYLGGNLDALGGLGPQAETLGQEKMIAASASQLMQYFMAKMHRFARLMIADVGLYVWTDPLVEIALVDRVPGTDIEVPFTWTPESREGAFPQYDIDIDPYSMSQRTPDGEQQKIKALLMEVLPAAAAAAVALSQVGAELNLEGVVKAWARYVDMRDVDEIVLFGGEPQGTEGGGPVGDSHEGVGFKPAQTTRTYQRVSRPGTTRSAKDTGLAMMAAGANLQPSEAAGAVQRVG